MLFDQVLKTTLSSVLSPHSDPILKHVEIGIKHISDIYAYENCRDSNTFGLTADTSTSKFILCLVTIV